MELVPIGSISRQFGVSTRTLRYYEQIGLLRSMKNESAYRYYDEEALERLKCIVILRKLRIPLSSIARILENRDAHTAVEAFRRNISELDDELSALFTIRNILTAFINHLNNDLDMDIRHSLLSDEKLLSLADALTVTKKITSRYAAGLRCRFHALFCR